MMAISDLPIVILRSLFITLMIEIILAVFLGYRHKDLVNVFLVNLLTNPILNCIVVAVNYYYGLRCRNITLIVLEIIAVIIEGDIYQKYLIKRKINGYVLSIILNLASFLLGMFINKLIY